MHSSTTESLLALSREQTAVVIIGGGPAGLSAAYELSNAGVQSTVLEGSKVVGGISRTVEYKGYLFDIATTYTTFSSENPIFSADERDL